MPVLVKVPQVMVFQRHNPGCRKRIWMEEGRWWAQNLGFGERKP